jgi:starvation-inducible DNA-binding protein
VTEAVQIGIPEQERAAVVEGLSRVLADSYSLYLRTHSYHWNVVGPMFHSLHAMFMEEYTELSLAVDEIAERIRALGAPAPGTFREFAALSSVAEDTDVPAATEMVRRLVSGHEATARTIREVLPVAESAPDQVSTDLLVRRLDVHEKTAWMLRSLLA